MKLHPDLVQKIVELARVQPGRKTASLRLRSGDKAKAKLAQDLGLWAKASGLPEPLPEHYFAKPRKWRFDHAWPDVLIAVEYEGLGGGRHQRPVGYSKDCEKYNTAQAMGWVVIRVTALNAAQVVVWLDDALELRKNTK